MNLPVASMTVSSGVSGRIEPSVSPTRVIRLPSTTRSLFGTGSPPDPSINVPCLISSRGALAMTTASLKDGKNLAAHTPIRISGQVGSGRLQGAGRLHGYGSARTEIVAGGTEGSKSRFLQRRIRCELDLGEGRFADEIACLSLAGRREVISSGVLPIRARTLAGAGVRCRAVVFRVQNGGRRGVFWVREAADVALKIIARRKPEPVYRPVAVEAVEVINFAITLATWLNSDDLVRRRLEATGEARRDRGRA
jgi:hypothetical protein